MSYVALYRKYRPKTFDAMVGQTAVVKTLKNQLRIDKISHAYLFCGTRGTGKTSAAKIFARAINCEKLEDGEPCNECEMCKAAMLARSLNVIEIDAASNNGVDNIREIREEVKYPPAKGRYKVYIIDEVHMLSPGAFNALLKTLEEPPPHVVFVLATTDPQKVPVTILSRCQRFDFKRIPTLDIADALQIYLENENANANTEALRYVARLSDGSMRDALSLLDQCLAYYSGEQITQQKVQAMTGAVDDSVFFKMTDSLIAQNPKEAMQTIEEMINAGRDANRFANGILNHYRNLMVAASVPMPWDILDMSKESAEQFVEQSKKLTLNQIMYCIREFSTLLGNMKYAPNPRLILEVAIMRLASPPTGDDPISLRARLDALEKKIEQGVSVIVQTDNQKIATKPKKKKAPPALSADRKDAVAAWPSIRKEFDPVLKGKLSQVSLAFKEEDDTRLYLVCAYDILRSMVEKNLEVISERLTSYLGKAFDITTISQEEYDAWYYSNYEQPMEDTQENEFQSLMNTYFDEADYKE